MYYAKGTGDIKYISAAGGVQIHGGKVCVALDTSTSYNIDCITLTYLSEIINQYH